MTAAIKSGTNSLHGVGWTYLSNSGWNANSSQNNRLGVGRAVAARQWYGGNVGGPVYIPRVQGSFFTQVPDGELDYNSGGVIYTNQLALDTMIQLVEMKIARVR